MQPMISLAEAARISGLSQGTLAGYLSSGRVTGSYSQKLVSREKLLTYLKNRKPRGRHKLTFQTWLQSNPGAQVIVAGVKAQRPLAAIARDLRITGEAVRSQVARWYKELGLAGPNCYWQVTSATLRTSRVNEISRLAVMPVHSFDWQNPPRSRALHLLGRACQQQGLTCVVRINPVAAKYYRTKSSALKSLISKRFVLISGHECGIYYCGKSRPVNPRGKTRHWLFTITKSAPTYYYALVTGRGDVFVIPRPTIAVKVSEKNRFCIAIPENSLVFPKRGQGSKKLPSRCQWLRYRGFPPEFFQPTQA